VSGLVIALVVLPLFVASVPRYRQKGNRSPAV
jgi:hypothetical protein